MKGILDVIVGLLEQIGQALLASLFSFAAAGVQAMANEGGDLLKDVVIKAVGAAQDHASEGVDKYKYAFDAATAELTSQGVTVATSVLNFAIEAAVQNLKAEMANIDATQNPVNQPE